MKCLRTWATTSRNQVNLCTCTACWHCLRDVGKKNNHTNELQPVGDGLPQAARAGRWEEAANNSACSIALETSHLWGCILQKSQAMPMHQTCFVGMYKPLLKKNNNNVGVGYCLLMKVCLDNLGRLEMRDRYLLVWITVFL